MNELVVASHGEDLSWLSNVPSTWEVAVYSTLYGNLPNVGREAGQWLHHIVTAYDSLADMTMFVQADKEHNPDSIDKLLLNPPTSIFGIVGIDNSPELQECLSPLSRKLLEAGWLGDTIPIPRKFRIGAQFFASKDAILSRPKDHYERLLGAVHKGGYGIDAAYILEPCWSSIFDLKGNF